MLQPSETPAFPQPKADFRAVQVQAADGLAPHPALICQSRCGQVHDRCTYPTKGVCSLTHGHARPHKCSICNQPYM